MRRIYLLLATCTLLALPAFAQSSPVPACGLAAPSPLQDPGWKLKYQPLESELRLFYDLSDLWQEVPFEVRYLVQNQPYLTEALDLSQAESPRLDLQSFEFSRRSATELDPEPRLERQLMVELLALQPDVVRELHQLHELGKAITVEVHQNGRLVETLSFKDLVRRSAELAQSSKVPLIARSEVSGSGAGTAQRLPATADFVYLDDCADCTTSTPCDTECGYDEGKGGPVTCGEYGVCAFQCACSTESYYWTPWYFVRAFLDNQFACLRSFTVSLPYGAWHRLYVEEWRRDYIRRTRICPNCPSCDNCYTVEEVVGYQLTYPSCWQEDVQICSNPSLPCCSSLCFVGPFTPCSTSC